MEELMTEVLKLLGSRIAVTKEMGAEKTEGGLYLPDNARERPQRGTVVVVGPGAYRHSNGNYILDPMTIKVGDTVFFPQYQGTTVKVNETEYLVFQEAEILGVIANESVT